MQPWTPWIYACPMVFVLLLNVLFRFIYILVGYPLRQEVYDNVRVPASSVIAGLVHSQCQQTCLFVWSQYRILADDSSFCLLACARLCVVLRQIQCSHSLLQSIESHPLGERKAIHIQTCCSRFPWWCKMTPETSRFLLFAGNPNQSLGPCKVCTHTSCVPQRTCKL